MTQRHTAITTRPTRRPTPPVVVALAIVTACVVDWPTLLFAVARFVGYALLGAAVVGFAAVAVLWGALFYLRPNDD